MDRYSQPGCVVAGFHSDLNFLTIHGKSRYPGLHIWLRDGTRVPVRIPGCCLCSVYMCTLRLPRFCAKIAHSSAIVNYDSPWHSPVYKLSPLHVQMAACSCKLASSWNGSLAATSRLECMR